MPANHRYKYQQLTSQPLVPDQDMRGNLKQHLKCCIEGIENLKKAIEISGRGGLFGPDEHRRVRRLTGSIQHSHVTICHI